MKMNKSQLEQKSAIVSNRKREVEKGAVHKRTRYVYLFIEIFFYTLIFLKEVFYLGSINIDIIKYTSITVCFIYVFFCSRSLYESKEKNVARVAFFFTFLADYFLLFTQKYYIGVGCFLVVQCMYLFRMSSTIQEFIYYLRKRIFVWVCGVIIMLSVYFLTGIWKETYSENRHLTIFLMMLCSLYAFIFIGNIILAWRLKNENKVFLIGLLLFFLCDCNVAIYNITEGISMELLSLSGRLIWLFYLPSQVLLVESFIKRKK